MQIFESIIQVCSFPTLKTTSEQLPNPDPVIVIFVPPWMEPTLGEAPVTVNATEIGDTRLLSAYPLFSVFTITAWFPFARGRRMQEINVADQEITIQSNPPTLTLLWTLL